MNRIGRIYNPLLCFFFLLTGDHMHFKTTCKTSPFVFNGRVEVVWVWITEKMVSQRKATVGLFTATIDSVIPGEL